MHCLVFYNVVPDYVELRAVLPADHPALVQAARVQGEGGNMARFYGYFAAAYGTIWFVLMLVAVATQSHINTGTVGLCGFPIGACIYALFRSSVPSREATEIQFLKERIRWLEDRLAGDEDDVAR